jgi:putative peptidoglycan lipid II flippase
MTSVFDFISTEQKNFLDVFIFYIFFQNILLFNKAILNLEHFYASYYFVDIFVYGVLFMTVMFFVETEILYIAYATLIATFIANMWQSYLIHKKLDIKYSFIFYNSNFKEIYKNSFKLKIGSLLYGSKDIIIASVFTSLGTGMFSLYSYANKFAGVILQVVNAPVVNIFATKANYHVANNRYDLLKNDIKKVLSQTIVLFGISGGITYMILPYLLSVLFGDKFSGNDILMIQSIFLVLLFFYLVVVIESPASRLVNIFKMFNISLLISFVFFILIAISFFAFKIFNLGYIKFLFLVILAQLSNLLIAYIVFFKKMRVKYD